MNINKNNNGGNNDWILCQSKSFPGKLYYFNIHNGEAVWSINSNEKTIPKIDNKFNIQRTVNKVPSYPEPSSPPTYTAANLFSNTWSDNGILSQKTFQNLPMFGPQLPIFGQQTLTPNFQNCLPMTNIIWTPIQSPFWPYISPSSTRTSSIERAPETLGMDEIIVHASGIPLSKRFINYEATSINFNKENKFEIVLSVPLSNSNSKTELSHRHIPDIPETLTGIVKDNFESIATQTDLDNSEMYADIPISPDKGNSIVKSCEKAENTEQINLGQATKKIIDDSDLRLVLIAKRRQFQAENVKESIEKKKVKLNVIQPAPKKKVTFNLENTHFDNYETYVPKSPSIRNIDTNNIRNGPVCTAVNFHKISGHMQVYDKANYDRTEVKEDNTLTNIYSNTNEDILRHNRDTGNAICKPENSEVNAILPVSKQVFSSDKDIWYLVVDMDVLLDDGILIDKLMQTDEKCRLLIPDVLHKELELLCVGDCGGQKRVLVARQLSRKIAAMHKQIIVEPPQSDDSVRMNTTDHIIKSCMNAIKDCYNVVLITNDKHLRNRANALQIRCYTAQEVKDGAIICPKLFTELKKIKLTIDNTKVHESDTFNQNRLSDLFSKKNNAHSNKDCDILYNITRPKSKIDQNVSHNILSMDTINRIDKPSNRESDNLNIFKDITQDILQPIHNGQNSDKTDQNHLNIDFTQNSKPNKFQSEKSDIRHSNSINREENDYPCNEDNNFHNNKNKYNKNNVSSKNIGQLENENSSKNHTKNVISKLVQNKEASTSDLKNVSDATDNHRSIFKIQEINVEGSLKTFCAIATDFNHTIRKRMDEWICTYTQIMEELLSSILQKKANFMSKMNISSTKLQDSLICIKMLYDDVNLKDIIGLLVKLLSQSTNYTGKIKLDTDPQVLMKIIGCGVLLVECLKNILPETGVLIDCESYLKTLLENIEAQDVDLELELLRPEVVCRSEVVSNKETRHNYTKDRSHIIKYLKKHFKEWAKFEDEEQISRNENPKVVRMNGKDLKWVKIDKNKSVSYIQGNHLNGINLETVRLSDNQQQDNKSPIIELKYNYLTKNDESAIKLIEEFDKVQFVKHGNTFDDKDDTTEPKIIRNIKLVDKYEDKIKSKEPLNIDYSNIDSSENNMSIKNGNHISGDDIPRRIDDDDSNRSIIISHNKISYNNNFYILHEDIKSNIIKTDRSANKSIDKVCGDRKSNIKSDLDNNKYEENNNNSKDYYENHNREVNCERNNNIDRKNTMQSIHRDDSTIDSGFENESTQAHSLVKTFLNELSCAFKVIYDFIANFTAEIREEAMCQDKKNIHHKKAKRCLTDMDGIVQQLKSIIHRESKEDTTLRRLLLSAGTEAVNDKRITRYRQIVVKCLEQARILESALRIIICITKGDLNAINYNSDISNSYINIFE